MRSHYPCPHCCSCHSAGPSTPRLPSKTSAPRSSTSRWNRTAPALLLAALVTPAFAAPASGRPDLGFLYPRLEKRVKDAGQAPDDASSGWFAPQNVEVEDLVRAGLSIKFVYDPSASTGHSPAAISEEEEEIREGRGAWVLDDFWELHGKRFGPHTATATADITDDPLPTATTSTPTDSATSTSTTIPTLLAIESSLPTGWTDPDYRNSGIYRIPIVISFAVVIALMIGFLIGALVYRRAQRRKRRRKKDAAKEGNDDDDDDALTEPSLREKTARKSLSARVGRALRATSHNSQLRRRLTPHAEADDISPTDVEHAEAAQADDTDLDRRIKSWARRSAAWRSHARAGMRRRMTKGQTPRRTPDVAADNDEPPNPNAVPSRTTSRAASPIPSTSRTSRDELPPPIVVVTDTSNEIDRQEAAVNPASTPTVPTYSSVSGSGTGSNLSQPGSSTSTSANTSHDAHPDATPGDEPAYEYGSGLPPAYRRGGGAAVMTEVRRGKMPMREWEGLDAGAFVPRQEEEEDGGEDMDMGGEERVVMAHVATDDKAVLEELRRMRGAPQVEPEMADVGEAPREEDVFDVPDILEGEVGAGGSFPPPPPGSSHAFPPPPENQTRAIPREDESVIPEPPAKVVGTGAVARYGEVDLSLPGYLERGSGSSVLEAFGPSVPPEELGPSVPPEEFGLSVPPETFGPSAPPEEHSSSAPPEFSPSALLAPSAPPLDAEEEEIPSAPPESDILRPSAPPLEHDHPLETPRLRHLNSSSPLLENELPR